MSSLFARLRFARARFAPAWFSRSAAVPAAAVLGLLAALTSCAPGVRYDVDARDARLGSVRVELRVRGAPRDSLELLGHAATDAMRLADVTVDAPGSGGFTVDSVRSSDVLGLAPRLVLRGPLPPLLTVRYRVMPAQREGDAHVGWTGRSFGAAGAGGVFATGRSLFLVPAGVGSSFRIGVREEHPQGWRAVTPWRRRDDWLRPGIAGRWEAEDLLLSSLAFGTFDTRDLVVGRTTYHLVFEATIPTTERARMMPAFERAIRYIHDTLGRELGADYTVQVMPETPDGDVLIGGGWASGQGGTLAPLTADRLHTFATRLVDAMLVSAPNALKPHAPDERWVLQGVRELVAWRAVARAGLADDTQIARDLAGEYATALVGNDTGATLETPDPHPDELSGPQPAVVTPLALLSLERALVDAAQKNAVASGVECDAASRAPVETAIRAMCASAAPGPFGWLGRALPAPSFWAGIPRALRPAAEAFRSRYVSGSQPLPAEGFFPFAAATPEPAPAGGPVRRQLLFAFTANTEGYLENCGCKVHQAGGVARRATVLAQLRARHLPMMVVDAGSTFPAPARRFDHDALAALEQQLYLSTLRAMRYDAVVVGATELAQGVEVFRDAARPTALPWVLANVRHGDDRPAVPFQSTRVGGVAVSVIGLFEAPRGSSADPAAERAAIGLSIDDPVATLKRAYPALRAHADLVVVAGRLEPATIRRLVQACPDVDLVISSTDQSVTRTETDGEVSLEEGDSPGFVGRTLVLYATLDSFGVGSAVVGLDAAGRVSSADIASAWLGDDVPEEQAMRAMLTRFYSRVGASDSAQASVTPLFPHDQARMTGTYVGAAICASCHAAETAQWKTTAHANAFKTLLDVHRHYQPRCVVCHVVGYGTPAGYRIGDRGDKLVNVQCEVCHGPGGRHVAQPSRATIRRAVPESVCLECHTMDHSDHFVYADRLPRVTHGIATAIASKAPAPPDSGRAR